jgi:hypothetical protein
MTPMDIEQGQRQVCGEHGAEYSPVAFDSKLGASADFRFGRRPLNGLRHPPEGDTCGWYLWSGEELSQATDFFQPLHVRHLVERCPEVLRFLALPPGWRFLIAEDYEDVWYDESLLKM